LYHAWYITKDGRGVGWKREEEGALILGEGKEVVE
jgi:hypothetical protein